MTKTTAEGRVVERLRAILVTLDESGSEQWVQNAITDLVGGILLDLELLSERLTDDG